MSFITKYWKVTLECFEGEESQIFAGNRPLPIYGNGTRAGKICGYKGTLLSGEHHEFTAPYTDPQPKLTLQLLGNVPPIYSAGQKLKLKQIKYRIADTGWKYGGWWYLIEPTAASSSAVPKWLAETTLQTQAKFLFD